jgi:serine/threonine protein phosphatase PrpC
MGLELSMPSPLEPEDTVLVASDGLLDNLTLAEIVDVLRDHDVTTAAKRLGELARQRMGTPVDPLKPSKPDDVTLAVYRPR